MISRLGDGVEGLSDTLGGGPMDDSTLSLGPKGRLFLGQRPARHEANLLAVNQQPTSAPPGGGTGEVGGGDSPGDGGGDGGAGGGDGGDG